jgi:hypothetical protein
MVQLSPIEPGNPALASEKVLDVEAKHYIDDALGWQELIGYDKDSRWAYVVGDAIVGHFFVSPGDMQFSENTFVLPFFDHLPLPPHGPLLEKILFD